MADILKCYRCGASLTKLTLPLSRFDQCPECSVDLHACRMCKHYDLSVAKACTEDDAEEVKDKRKANFCEYFAPTADAFDPAEIEAARRAEATLGALFGGSSDGKDPKAEADPARAAAEKLFR